MSKIEVPREILERMLGQIKEIEGQVAALLEGKETLEVQLSEIRYYGPLALVHREGMVVTSERLSSIMKSFGRNPQGAAGYFSSKSPTMTAVGGEKRALTPLGEKKVAEAARRFGNDWLDRLPMVFVSDSVNSDSTKINF